MTSYVNDLWPGSPAGKASLSGSGTGRSSRLPSRSRNTSSSASSRSASRRTSRSSSSRSWTPRSRSRSQPRRPRRCRRYSRSYSRSRSRSRGRRHWERPPPRAYRRYSGSPWRGRPRRSRSRSRGRSYYRRAYVGPRGRRVHPETRRSWSHRSRSRSRSPALLRLSDKDRMELLEIAKANAAKALGTASIDLPASLRTGSQVKDTNCGKQIQGNATKLVELSGRLNEDVIKTSNESSSLQRTLPFNSGNSLVNPVLQKTAKEIAGSHKDEKNQSSYGQWIPIKKEETN